MGSALPYYAEMPNKIKAKAREALAAQLGLKLDRMNADAVIEQVWNALVGHDQEKPRK